MYNMRPTVGILDKLKKKQTEKRFAVMRFQFIVRIAEELKRNHVRTIRHRCWELWLPIIITKTQSKQHEKQSETKNAEIAC